MSKHLKSLAAGALALFAGASAHAADLPSSKALPPLPELPPLYSWTGFHAGGQVGYAWASNRTRFIAANGGLAGVSPSFDGDAAVGGVNLGYDFQAGAIVLGVEGDIEAVGGNGRFLAPAGFGRTTQDVQGSVRARAGFAFDRFLIYATGGVSFTEFEHRLVNTTTGAVQAVDTSRTGWTAGGGVAFAVTSNIVAGLEYRYTDYDLAGRFGRRVFLGIAADHEATMHTVRTSVSYKF